MTMREKVDAAIDSLAKASFAFQIEGYSFRKWDAGDCWKVAFRAHHSGWYQSMYAHLDCASEAEADAAIAYAKSKL